MVRSQLRVAVALGMLWAGSVHGQVVFKGETAPLFRGQDEELRTVDMADGVDGRPLVFLHGSAT